MSPLNRAVVVTVALLSPLLCRGQADTVAARVLMDSAKKQFSHPAIADSLAHKAYQLSGNNLKLRGESAFIVMFANGSTNFARTRQWGDSARQWFAKANNHQWLGYVNRVVGFHASRTNRNELGVESYLAAIREFEIAKDTSLVSQTETSLGLLYHNNLMDFEKGLEYAMRGYNRLMTLKNPGAGVIWHAINCVAINLDDSKRYDEAIEWHKKNLNTTDLDNKSSTLNNIGNTLRKKGQFVESEKYFLECLAITPREDTYDCATVFLNLAQVNEDLKRRKQALMYNDSSLYYSHKSNNIEKLRDSYEFAHRIYLAAGENKRAYEALSHYLDIKDSAFNKDKAQIIYGLQEKFESAEKERQITELQNTSLIKDLALQRSRFMIYGGVGLLGLVVVTAFWLNKRQQYRMNLQRAQEREEQQRQRFSAVIEAEENERSRVAKDLHDGLGQLISTAKLGLTAIQLPAEQPQAKILSNSVQVLDQAATEVRSIAHNLMPAALMERGLQVALEDMVQKINDAKLLEVELRIELGEQRLPPTVEVAVYRVIQEVMNNMIKHAKAKKIMIALKREGQSLRLGMSDDGVGFDKSMMTQSKGIGWKSIFSRIAMLHGNIEVTSMPGEGTQISIQFAIS